ncbi:MAG: CvpA family protein [Salinivirgaceae bacterium]|jgi:membrane protein required for colicin V production
MNANIFDVVVIGVLVLGAFHGYIKGLISSAASLAALLLGVWGAIKFSGFIASFLSGWMHTNERTTNIIAFAVTFVLIVIAIHLIAKVLEGIAEASALGVVNKVFGSAFGVLKYALLLSIVLVVINAIRPSAISPELKQKSLFYKPIASFAPTIFHRLKFEELKKEAEEKVGVVNS